MVPNTSVSSILYMILYYSLYYSIEQVLVREALYSIFSSLLIQLLSIQVTALFTKESGQVGTLFSSQCPLGTNSVPMYAISFSIFLCF